jgi:3',5'-cyclic AMP phosphodiesterase CpdA
METMASRLSRRRFLRAGAAALPLASSAQAFANVEPDAPPRSFRFVALGDMHFDRPELHDMDWLRRDHPGDVAQVENYSRITREVTPRLLDEVRRAATATDVPVRFVAQLGDLVEGMCGSPHLALRQCEGAVALIRRAELGVPFFAAKGNHEIQGPGAADAFNRVLLPFLGGRHPHDQDTASFTIEEGAGLFVFLDAYDREALGWLERTLAARKARHLFVLLHPPVVPFGARSLWHLYSRPADESRRRRLLDLLGEHRAIVLCAHLHRYGVVVRRTDTGRFLQLALCSVLPRPDVQPRDAAEGLDQYGPDLVTIESRFSPETEEARREALRAERPFINHFEYADAPGYAIVSVGDERVRAEIHVGLERRPWKSLDLTALLSRS